MGEVQGRDITMAQLGHASPLLSVPILLLNYHVPSEDGITDDGVEGLLEVGFGHELPGAL